MIDYELDVDPEGRRLLALLGRFDREARDFTRIGVESIAMDARQELREQYLSGNPLRERTGELKAAWRYRLTGRRKDRARVYPGRLGYFGLLDRGGTIEAKRAQVLRFEVDGVVYFARSVKLPRRPVLTPFVRRYNASGRGARIAREFIERRLAGLGLL